MNSFVRLRIVKSGIHTILIRQNRMGLQKYGVPPGGPMDIEMANQANWLVGNKEDSPLLEITLQGPVIEFSGNCQIAITGATAPVSVNSTSIEQNKTTSINNGDVLTIGKTTNGSRAYLAVRGEWPLSDSENTLQNYVFKKEDELFIKPGSRPLKQRTLPIIDYSDIDNFIIKSIPGPEWDELPDRARKAITSTTFMVLPESNRMGYRLSPSLPNIDKSIISSGIVPGVLQVTPEGLPILLMQDGPTTGGYVRALTVLAADLPKLGQLRPGDQFRFLMQ